MRKIDIKPLTVNQAWQGKRYKTKKYKEFEKSLLYLLPKNIKIPEKIDIYLEFGFSNRNSDWDNPIKPFIDVLQQAYEFNDNKIYRAEIVKKIVKKGDDYIKFKIKEY